MSDFIDEDSRLDYLKAHGVEIETVEDRAAAVAAARERVAPIKAQLSLSPSSVTRDSFDDGCVELALVPADDSKPMRRIYLPGALMEAKDSIPGFVKPYFADSVSVDAGLLNEQATKQFASGDMKDLANKNISAAAMNAVAAQGSVETFPLVHPAETNGFTGVYIYLDEVGLLKKLPQNSRATAIAANCGYSPPPNFYGDIFIGRSRTRPVMRNVDFVIGADTAGDAEWMKRAVGENVAWQQAMNEVTGKTSAMQASNKGEDGNVEDEGNFTWRQEDEEVELTVPLGGSINKRDVKVNFGTRTLKVTYDCYQKVDIKLYAQVDPDGCAWTIDGDSIVVTLEKADGGKSWPRVKEGA